VISEERSLDGMLAALSIDYVIGDASHTVFPSGQFDLIHSNNTLEHIPAEILGDILVEMKRIGKADGLHSHFVDMSDHFAHMDRTITPYNFLRFSKRQWRLINNRLQYMNRLRLQDYRSLFQQAGYTLLHQQLRADTPELLDDIHVHPDFAVHSKDDLRVTHAHFVCT
jgi:ubiquinone/menaquinone biosynthesis C-methylase UbiE